MNAFRWSVAVTFVLATAAVPANAGRILRVAQFGADTPSCGADATPCRSIGQAIDNAVNGDVLYVDAGLYGDLNGDLDYADPGEERPNTALGCLVCVTKEIRIFSRSGPDVTHISATGLPSMSVVLLDANHVTFQGFSVREGSRAGIRTGSRAANITLRADFAESNGTGFELSSTRNLVSLLGGQTRLNSTGLTAVTTGAGRVLVGSVVAYANAGTGFRFEGTNINQVGNLQNKAGSNAALYNVTGFEAAGVRNDFEGNIAMANFQQGFLLSGRSQSFQGNRALHNFGPGGRITPTAVGIAFGADIYGNRGTGSDGRMNCGVVNESGRAQTAGGFWGSRNGPGPDPADEAGPGSGCDIGAGSVTTFGISKVPL